MRMDRHQQAATEGREVAVVAIELVAGSSRAEEWGCGGAVPQAGDVVEEIRIGSSGAAVRAPFKGGCAGINKSLRAAFKRGDTSIAVRARRIGGAAAELQACIVPSAASGGRRQFVLRSIHDPNYAVGFVDRTQSECFALQGSRGSRVVSALSMAQVQDGYVSYPWDKKLRQATAVASSSTTAHRMSFLSLLILPKASDASSSRYNSIEDTLARANAWLRSAAASGVPILLTNVQTEALLTKISGETASATVSAGSLSDLSDLANVSLYGFEDYHGVDIGVVRAVRLWYAPAGGELAVEIKLVQGDTRLGFAISRTEEGFIYISSVVDNNGDDEDDDSIGVPSTRSGLRDLYKAAVRESKLLVISRVSNEKVLPWMVASTGAIRCFDTVSISQKLSLHRHALRPILLHLFMWEAPSPPNTGTARAVPPPSPPFRPVHDDDDDHVDHCQPPLGQDTIGDASFRFHGFADALPDNNWV